MTTSKTIAPKLTVGAVEEAIGPIEDFAHKPQGRLTLDATSLEPEVSQVDLGQT